MNAEQAERHRYIGQVLSNAMRDRKDCDWTKEGSAIIEAQAQLDEQVTRYVLDEATREDVRLAYKAFADLHR